MSTFFLWFMKPIGEFVGILFIVFVIFYIFAPPKSRKNKKQ